MSKRAFLPLDLPRFAFGDLHTCFLNGSRSSGGGDRAPTRAEGGMTAARCEPCPARRLHRLYVPRRRASHLGPRQKRALQPLPRDEACSLWRDELLLGVGVNDFSAEVQGLVQFFYRSGPRVGAIFLWDWSKGGRLAFVFGHGPRVLAIFLEAFQGCSHFCVWGRS